MSQVDDWSDGYTSDYLRDLNTYGPASANVPRPSSVVSHRVQYQPPVAQTEAKTNDTPLYDNDGGFNPGPQRLVSAPARPFRGNATAAQRAARPKPAVKKKTQSASKQQTQSASKQQPQPEYRTGGARTPEENEITRSAAEHRTGADLGQLSSQALDAAARFLPALKLLGFGAGAGSADTASTDRPSYMGAAGTMADNFARTLPQPSAASRQTAPESSSTEGQFENMPWYKDAKAHHEAVKKNVDDYGSVLGTLKSTWDDIPWWTKLVMLPPVFKAGSPAAGASAAGNVWAEEGRAAAGNAAAGAAGDAAAGAAGNAAAGAAGDAAAGAAGDAAAGAGGRSFGFDLSAEDVAAANAANAAARQQAVNLSEMRSTLMHAGMPDREIEAYMHGAGFYNDPEALRQAIDVVRKHGMAGLFEHSAAEAAAARAGSAAGTGAGSAAGTGVGSAAGTGAGSAAGTGARGSFGFDLSPEEIASAKASHDAYVRGAAGAADGGVSELANAGNVGREAAAGAATGAADGGVSELIQHIRSGTLDEMERAWIEATAAGAAKAPGTIDASTQAILNEARAAGILGRDAAGTAGAADGGVSELANAGNVGREAAAGEQAASREAVVAARNAAVAKLDPQLQAALANVRKSLANHNISPRQVLQELEAATASDKDFYEIGRIFYEVGSRTHGAGLSPAEQAVADAYIKGAGERLAQGWTRVGRGLTHAVDKNSVRVMIDDIKNGTVDPNSLEYIRGLARNSGLTPESQALVDAARSAGLIP